MNTLNQDIETLLGSEKLLEQLKEILSPLNSTLANEILVEMQQIQQEFLSLAQDVLEVAELRRALALRYIELKARWIMYNTRMQYHLLLTGENDERLVYTASSITVFLAAMESLLSESDIKAINQFLLEPLAGFQAEEEVAASPVIIKVKNKSIELSGIISVEFQKR